MQNRCSYCHVKGHNRASCPVRKAKVAELRAKKEAGEMRGVLKRLQSRSWAEEIENEKNALEEISREAEDMDSKCKVINKVLERRQSELVELDKQIDSAPVEPINISAIRTSIESFESETKDNIKNKITSLDSKKQKEELATELGIELSHIPIDKLNKLRDRVKEIKTEKAKLESKHKLVSSQYENQEKKEKLLDGIPCGNKFPNCKFICDANKAMEGLPQLKEEAQELAERLHGLTEKLLIMDLSEIEEQLKKYDKLQGRINKSTAEAKQLGHRIEKYDLTNERIKSDLQGLRRKEALYEENKETIENLGTLCKERISLKKMISNKEKEIKSCKERLQHLFIEQGSTQTTMKALEENQQELEIMEKQWTAYDLFMQCVHPNGIPYNIIKRSLPLINEEIAKVLANIVEFEVFFDNADGKLDIYIKHPNYGPRPMSMGSGAEKTIAAMAIRLALISITNLPKSELFILDEPATALDQEHMEGFIRLLDMIKNQFKTVILISHLDSLKDVVDMTIDIQREGSYAKVRI